MAALSQHILGELGVGLYLPAEKYERRLAIVVSSTVFKEAEKSNNEKCVRVIAEALGEHGEPQVAPVCSVAVLSAEEDWISWPISLQATACRPMSMLLSC